ncbi:MAG: hypothetical protein RCG15_02270 [Candidatus Rickettsia vulgarisii]
MTITISTPESLKEFENLLEKPATSEPTIGKLEEKESHSESRFNKAKSLVTKTLDA